MTSDTTATQRQNNKTMVDRIRAMPRQEYADGHYALRVASTPGRITGLTRVWPIAVVQVDTVRAICTPNPHTDWARNVSAAGWCCIEGDTPDRYQTERIQGTCAAKIVSTYLAALGNSPQTMHWPFPADASIATITKYLNAIAVFQLKQ